MEKNQTRFEKRRKRRFNRLFNSFIAVSAISLVYFGASFIFNDEEQAARVSQQPGTEEAETNTINEKENEIQNKEREHSNEGNTERTGENTEELQDNSEVSQEWKPIGTEQEEPFVRDFSKDSLNWKEMTIALQYATGLGEEMIIWYIGNGGDEKSVIGTVSDATYKDKPYQVKLQWITNEGWMPVEKIQLEENPYIQ